MGDIIMHTKFWSENPNGRNHSEGLGLGERILLEWILGKQARKVWTGFAWLRIDSSGGLL
jgi:hypothetical protein